jgi:hypothetical protein
MRFTLQLGMTSHQKSATIRLPVDVAGSTNYGGDITGDFGNFKPEDKWP